jgi:hypothetical protein
MKMQSDSYSYYKTLQSDWWMQHLEIPSQYSIWCTGEIQIIEIDKTQLMMICAHPVFLALQASVSHSKHHHLVTKLQQGYCQAPNCSVI